MESHRWIPGALSGKLQWQPPGLDPDAPCLRVCDHICWSNFSWNLEPISRHLTNEEGTAIVSIPISQVWEDDRLICPFEKDGAFSVRSGYHKFHQVRSHNSLQLNHTSHVISPQTWKIIWGFVALPKVQHFLWRAYANAVPVMANLFKRTVIKSSFVLYVMNFLDLGCLVFSALWL